MRIFIVAAIAALCTAPAVATETPIWQEVMKIDCNGGFTLLGSSPLKLQLSGSLIAKGYTLATDMITERAQCANPDYTDLDVKTLFVPSLEAAMDMLVVAFEDRVGQETFNADPGVQRSMTTTLLPIVRDALERRYGLLGSTAIDASALLPTSCNPAGYMEGEACEVMVPLPGVDLEIQLSMKQCPNNAHPFVSLTLGGSLADNMFRPCADDTDCNGGSCFDTGLNATNIMEALHELSVAECDPVCPDENMCGELCCASGETCADEGGSHFCYDATVENADPSGTGLIDSCTMSMTTHNGTHDVIMDMSATCSEWIMATGKSGDAICATPMHKWDRVMEGWATVDNINGQGQSGSCTDHQCNMVCDMDRADGYFAELCPYTCAIHTGQASELYRRVCLDNEWNCDNLDDVRSWGDSHWGLMNVYDYDTERLGDAMCEIAACPATFDAEAGDCEWMNDEEGLAANAAQCASAASNDVDFPWRVMHDASQHIQSYFTGDGLSEDTALGHFSVCGPADGLDAIGEAFEEIGNRGETQFITEESPMTFDACTDLGCDPTQVGDWVCNTECNVKDCHWDGGDCVGGADDAFLTTEDGMIFLERTRIQTESGEMVYVNPSSNVTCCDADEQGWDDCYNNFNGPMCGDFYYCATPWCDQSQFLDAVGAGVRCDYSGEDGEYVNCGGLYGATRYDDIYDGEEDGAELVAVTWNTTSAEEDHVFQHWDGILSDGTTASSNARMLSSADPVPTAAETLVLNSAGAKMGLLGCDGTFAMGIPLPGLAFVGRMPELMSFTDFIGKTISYTKECKHAIEDGASWLEGMGADFMKRHYHVWSPDHALSIINNGTSWLFGEGDTIGGRVNMPDTCNYDDFTDSGSCMMEYDNDIDWLIGQEASLLMEMKRCEDTPDGLPGMAFVVKAQDWLEDLLTVTLCGTDADCAGDGTCEDLAGEFEYTGGQFDDASLDDLNPLKDLMGQFVFGTRLANECADITDGFSELVLRGIAAIGSATYESGDVGICVTGMNFTSLGGEGVEDFLCGEEVNGVVQVDQCTLSCDDSDGIRRVLSDQEDRRGLSTVLTENVPSEWKKHPLVSPVLSKLQRAAESVDAEVAKAGAMARHVSFGRSLQDEEDEEDDVCDPVDDWTHFVTIDEDSSTITLRGLISTTESAIDFGAAATTESAIDDDDDGPASTAAPLLSTTLVLDAAVLDIDTSDSEALEDLTVAIQQQVQAEAGEDAIVEVVKVLTQAVSMPVVGFCDMINADQDAFVVVVCDAVCDGSESCSCEDTTTCSGRRLTRAARDLQTADAVEVETTTTAAEGEDLPAPVVATELTTAVAAGLEAAAETFTGDAPSADDIQEPTVEESVAIQVEIVQEAAASEGADAILTDIATAVEEATGQEVSLEELQDAATVVTEAPAGDGDSEYEEDISGATKLAAFSLASVLSLGAAHFA